ncbi:cyclin-dependent kinases regulatory subunit 1 isoform X2 [Pipra filicauda]|uniref:Cyclin-dependent kinases regulatory subunit n=2 Tax=Pipridae TaxID=114313 RepID=A0A6J2H2R0_9PASS|nr:cyclin-dependent kinases regulatory subunit 1 isoform X2 [Pipra filicauda]
MDSRPAPPLGGAGQWERGAAAFEKRPRKRGGGATNGRWGGEGGGHGGPVMAHKQIYYSDKYDDEEFEYRYGKGLPGERGDPVTGGWHVMLPKDIAKLVPKTHLLSESEWRNLGVQQSQGWVHYMIHEPEPHILLFRRPLPKKPEK